MEPVLEIIKELAQDASHNPGYQAKPLYILINIAAPLSLGILVYLTRRIGEKQKKNLEENFDKT